MFSKRCLKRLSILGLVLALAACTSPGGPAASQSAQSAQPSQPLAVRTDGACQTPSGLVANGTVVSRCFIDGQGITSCPRYLCRRCTSGTLGEEYTCLRP